jgi:kynurenine formamidase
MSWKFLSYPLNNKAFGYGNGERFNLNSIRSMCCGDTSNNSEFSMPTHYGTHIDYPFHFSDEGKKSSAYKVEDFVFNSVGIIDISEFSPIEDYLIKNAHLDLSQVDKEAEILIVKTGFTHKRSTDEYWEKGYGFHPETAKYIKENLPNIKAIAFDLISLNSYQNREIGREAHKDFLIENDILIIEELDLRELSKSDSIKKIIVAPLQLEEADGAPCTILAELDEH